MTQQAGNVNAARERALEMDRADPLGPMREAFHLREGLIYLDGNSLGAMPKCAASAVEAALHREWGEDLIESWNKADWIGLPQRAGAKIAALVGAGSDDVVVTDSTSVNLFKVLAAALSLRPDRRVIVSERSNFPTDLYMVEGLMTLLGRDHSLKLVDRAEDIAPAMSEDVAVVMLTHVNYRDGRMLDMADLTERAHAVGALTIWDLAHSAGAVPVALSATNADFAVGCGYKFLNGGPGAPAFCYVAPHLQEDAVQPLSGWFGHRAPFDFTPSFKPATGIARFLTGTPPVLSMTALDKALSVWRDVDMAVVREKSLALSDLFVERVEALTAGGELTLLTPRDHASRGSQISFRHPSAYPVMQALISRGVVGDFRAPDILRFGLTPLYLRYVDVFDAAAILADILSSGIWREDQYNRRARVT
ncbi:kynureninase [Pararhizobium haloflavum]|uniref:kynureninase n=1 Tax=Pararhizobium haloflavum TaxID=2037914 RepID=UPI000C1A5E35|nr:kynureninase [Pararhizobium haloflavum]